MTPASQPSQSGVMPVPRPGRRSTRPAATPTADPGRGGEGHRVQGPAAPVAAVESAAAMIAGRPRRMRKRACTWGVSNCGRGEAPLLWKTRPVAGTGQRAGNDLGGSQPTCFTKPFGTPSRPTGRKLRRVNPDERPRGNVIQGSRQAGQQGLDILNAILARTKHNDRNGQLCKVLLEFEVAVCRDKNLKPRCRQREKLAVLDARPALALNRADVVPGDQRRKAALWWL
jgi:hypothetical protein